jgi:hypothetical protein
MATDSSVTDQPAPADPPMGENHASLDAALAAQQGTAVPTVTPIVTPHPTTAQPGTPGYFTGAAPAAPDAPWAAWLGTGAPAGTGAASPAPPEHGGAPAE